MLSEIRVLARRYEKEIHVRFKTRHGISGASSSVFHLHVQIACWIYPAIALYWCTILAIDSLRTASTSLHLSLVSKSLYVLCLHVKIESRT